MFKAFIFFAELVTAVSLAQSLSVGYSMAKRRLERDILGPKGGAIHTACVTDPLKFQTWVNGLLRIYHEEPFDFSLYNTLKESKAVQARYLLPLLPRINSFMYTVSWTCRLDSKVAESTLVGMALGHSFDKCSGPNLKNQKLQNLCVAGSRICL